MNNGLWALVVVPVTMGVMFLLAIAADRVGSRISDWIEANTDEEYDVDYDSVMDAR